MTSTAAVETLDEVLPQARKLQRPAVEAILRAHYPRVCRIAYALCGDDEAGKTAVKIVMRQSLAALPRWRNEAQASNWFLHHVILKSRDLTPPPQTLQHDSLLRRLVLPSPEYIAFLRAFRLLPPQQREAFILFRGEKLKNVPWALNIDGADLKAGLFGDQPRQCRQRRVAVDQHRPHARQKAQRTGRALRQGCPRGCAVRQAPLRPDRSAP